MMEKARMPVTCQREDANQDRYLDSSEGLFASLHELGSSLDIIYRLGQNKICSGPQFSAQVLDFVFRLEGREV